jgi:hypothetical protein
MGKDPLNTGVRAFVLEQVSVDVGSSGSEIGKGNLALADRYKCIVLSLSKFLIRNNHNTGEFCRCVVG